MPTTEYRAQKLDVSLKSGMVYYFYNVSTSCVALLRVYLFRGGVRCMETTCESMVAMLVVDAVAKDGRFLC
jgi:hypothetical protein